MTGDITVRVYDIHMIQQTGDMIITNMTVGDMPIEGGTVGGVTVTTCDGHNV